MTLTKESEALVARLFPTPPDHHTVGREYRERRDRLIVEVSAIEAAVRIEQAAEFKRLRRLLSEMVVDYHQTGLIRDHVDPNAKGWDVNPDWRICEDGLCVEARAALAPVAPVAPAPAAFRCPAVLFHGPGHQSSSTCEREDPHPLSDDHWAEQSWRFQWTGDDEAPVAPAPAAPERCGCGEPEQPRRIPCCNACSCPIPFQRCEKCGEVRENRVHSAQQLRSFHPFQTEPVAPAPAATEPVGTMTDDEWAEWSDAIAPEPRP